MACWEVVTLPNTIIKFVKETTNEVLYVGAGYDWRLQKNGLEGFAGFEANVSTSEDYSRDGGTTDNIRLSDKDRTIKICNINWRSNQTERAKAQRFFTYNTDYKIYITTEGVQRWVEGTLYRMQLNEPTDEDYLLKATISFHFDSPYLMSVDNFGRDIASLTPNFGFPWMSNISHGTAVGIFNFERSVILRNDGDNIAYPKIVVTFKAAVLNPVVSINEGFIRILGTFGVTDRITIDYTVNPPRIEDNGDNIMGICDRASDFDNMYILIGENTVSFDADNGTDEMSVSVFYNRLYTVI